MWEMISERGDRWVLWGNIWVSNGGGFLWAFYWRLDVIVEFLTVDVVLWCPKFSVSLRDCKSFTFVSMLEH
ncbi:hypothetical protein P691DRAFT_801732 [Macrolepiota fuliginosa MF-IS2]|uniref:Transmembrane protein n=1 Tax=Macrolepiota fuliginosa MF-IS2 TaxID=1400762 RepID=A0A9P5XDJ2_9AGAR|nr:hypothetical protein P691DRAFT_801732 [Macrolepiota fuliginosa MF-IS2]